MVTRYENWHQPWCVVHGAGALRTLDAELDQLGVERVLLLTTRSLSGSALLSDVRAALGSRLAAEFHRCRQHTPLPSVFEAAERLGSDDVDALVALGGSSVIDTGKAVNLARAGGLDGAEQPGADTRRFLPLVALPTTLSGSEYTNVVGVVDPRQRRKLVYSNDRLTPRLVVLDPVLARDTPSQLWASTGVKIMSDAIEQLYSRSSHPVSDALAVAAIERLSTHLPDSLRPDEDSILECYLGAWFAVFSVFCARAMPGVGCTLRHQVGAVSGAPHAEITCALLPHVLRFNLPAAPHVVDRLAQALGVERTPDARVDETVDLIARRVEAMVASVALPGRLRDLGVKQEDFPLIADHAMSDESGVGNPRDVDDSRELIDILRAAY